MILNITDQHRYSVLDLVYRNFRLLTLNPNLSKRYKRSISTFTFALFQRQLPEKINITLWQFRTLHIFSLQALQDF